MLFGDGLLDLGLCSGFGFADPGIAFHFCCARHPEALEVALWTQKLVGAGVEGMVAFLGLGAKQRKLEAFARHAADMWWQNILEFRNMLIFL